MVWIRESSGPTSSATTQAQLQGFQVVHTNICIICEPLGCLKGPVLQIHRCKSQGNSRTTRRSPGEDPVWMVSQEPETWNQINDSLQ